MSWLRKVFGLKPKCEHQWVLAEEKTTTTRGLYDTEDTFMYQTHTRWYVCPKCLKTKTIRMTV